MSGMQSCFQVPRPSMFAQPLHVFAAIACSSTPSISRSRLLHEIIEFGYPPLTLLESPTTLKSVSMSIHSSSSSL